MVRRMRAVNDYSSTITSAINSSVTSITVASATGLPTEGDFYLLVDDEVVLVTHVSGTTLTVIRGQEDTTAVAHAPAAAIEGIITAGYFEKSANERRGIKALPYGRCTRWDGTSLSFLTATDFTLYNTGTGTAVADGNDDTILFTGKDGSTNQVTMAARTFSTSSDWRIVAHLGCPTFDPSFDSLHFVARDATAGTLKGIEMRPRIWIGYRERPSFTSAGTDTFLTGCGGRMDFWAKLEIEWNVSGSDDELRWYLSRDGVHWWLLYTSTFAANDQQVGIGLTNITGALLIRSQIFRWHEEALTF